jgi:hypothetical protein
VSSPPSLLNRFGKTDDLWGFGKPQGWGGPWRNTEVVSGQVSDPYLMTGFDKKTLHVETHDARPVQVGHIVFFLSFILLLFLCACVLHKLVFL